MLESRYAMDKWGGGNVWREMQMQAGAMRMLLAVYTDVRRRHANRSSVAQIYRFQL